MADEFGISFFETSAKSSAIGVDKAFVSIAEKIQKRLASAEGSHSEAAQANTVDLESSSDKKRAKKCC